MVLHCKLDEANGLVISVVPGTLGISCCSRVCDRSINDQPQIYQAQVHQQKSTFLIPSYSILLHLIPLILGVRRE